LQIEIQTDTGILRGVVTKGDKLPTRGVILLHPHPLYGGDMHNNVIVAVDNAVKSVGVSTLRFDFRGPNSSSGKYGGPRGAIEDASSMILYMKDKMGITDLGIIGYSFGGSVALGASINHRPSFLVTISASIEILKESGVILEDLSMTVCPSLLVHGTNDRMVPFSDMRQISSYLGGSIELFPVESEGHFFPKSLPDVVREVSTHIHHVWSTDLFYN